MTGKQVCERCAREHETAPAAFLAHLACEDRDCACARNDHRGPVEPKHDEPPEVPS